MKTQINRREDFPALDQKFNGFPFVYLDTAATSLKPRQVLDTVDHFNRFESANIHRGAYSLSNAATEKFEKSRAAVQKFINAKNKSEIIFTKGTTDSINFVAQTYCENNLSVGDEIILTEMEHHSNIVPWQILAKKNKLKINWIPVTNEGELDLVSYKSLLSPRTKFVSIVHCSNALGTVNPIKEIISLAHKCGAKVLVDAAQSVTFMPIDVQALDCDFLAFSAHKLYGMFGVGVLYGKLSILENLNPLQGGGSMISSVTKEDVSFLDSPHKFEAGTPNVSGVIALHSALEYVEKIGLENIHRHESELAQYALQELAKIDGLRFIGQSASRVNIVSFIIKDIHSSDIGQILDQQGIAVRAGHHCAQPLMNRFALPGTVRVSFGVHNTGEDVDILLNALKKVVELLS